MGSLVGHVLPGLGFFLFGLWHLFNHIKIYATNPKCYKSTPWFPTPKIRYLELYFIIFGASTSIAMELFIGPSKHQPLDVDGTIPTFHLHNFEHASISLSLLVYAVSAIILDKIDVIKSSTGGIRDDDQLVHIAQFIAALAFGQELLLFHLHSTDHVGLEGHYHMLLQLIIFVSLATTLMSIGSPGNFLISFVRSLSIIFQGVWFNVLGYMMYIPALVPKGCFLRSDDGRLVVNCGSEDALYRAKALVTLQFCWYLTGMAIFSVFFYKVFVEFYGKKVEYTSVRTKELDDETQENALIIVELQNKIQKIDHVLDKSDDLSPFRIE